MRSIPVIIWLFSIVCFAYACKSDPQMESQTLVNQKKIDEALLKTNRFIVRRDKDHIANYVKRRGLDMEKTETGIWYMIVKKGSNKSYRKGEVINYAFQLELIDGTKLDSASHEKPRQWYPNKSNSESGFDEMMQILGKGDKAIFILPPYLAYGNFGDAGRSIPPGAILVYDIEILNAQAQ